jgi:hypothetical protein
MYVLMNHSLTEEQRIDAAQNLGIDEVVQAPKEILDLWGNIPPEMATTELHQYLKPICDWIAEDVGRENVVLVQGEPVATYLINRFIQKRHSLYGTFCVAATTKRVVVEEQLSDGSIIKKSTFQHVRFRPYF